MLLTCENIIKILPIVRFELYNKESSFLIQTNLLNDILLILKIILNINLKYLHAFLELIILKIYIDFKLYMNCLSIKYNSRIRIKVL
jgi:hypothetical protein